MKSEAKPFIPSSAATPASTIETAANFPNDPSSSGELRKIPHHVNSVCQCQNSQKYQLQNHLDPFGNDRRSSDSNDHVTSPNLTNQEDHTNEISTIFKDGINRKSQNQQTAAFVQLQINTDASANAGESNAIRNLAPHRQVELGGRCKQSKRRVNKSRKKQNEFFIPTKSSFYTSNENDNPRVTRRNNSRSTPQNDDLLIHNKSSPNERGRSFEKTNAANVWDEDFSHKQKQRRRRNRKQQSKYQKGRESANEDDRNSMSVDINPDESQIPRKQSLSKSQQKQLQQRHQRKNNRREMPCTTKHGKHLGGSAYTNNGRELWGESTNAALSNNKNLKHEKFSKSKAIIDNQTEGAFITDEGSFPTLTSKINDAFSVSEVEKSPKRNLIHSGESCWASKVATSVQLEIQQQQVLEEEKRLREQEKMSGRIHLISLSSHSTRSKHGKERNNVDNELAGASIHDQYDHEDAVPREHEIEESSINHDTSRASIEETALALQSPSARHGGDSSTHSMPHILPNAKLKWSDKEISKMRRRLWMALREKRRKEERVCLEKASQKEKLVNGVDKRVDFDSSDDSSTSSLLSSSSSSSLSSEEDQSENNTKQPPSLKNRPFDEVDLVPKIISQPQQHSALQSRSVLDLERTCRHSQHPIHYIICHMAMMKIGGINDIDEKCCKYVSSTNLVLEHHGKSDGEIVLDSLLTSQEMKEWRTSRVDPKSLYFEWRNKNSCLPSHGFMEPKVFTNLLSADTTSMTPLQLAVYWNLPKAIRALLSTTTPETLASHNDNRPHSKSNKAFEEDEYGRTPLMLACELRHLGCIEALLSAMKVKTEHRDRKHGNTAFHYCCAKSLSEIDSIQDEEPIPQSSSAAEAIEILLNRTPQNLRKRVFLLTNRCGETILHLTCSSGDLILLECLIKHLFERGQTFARKAFTVKNQLGHAPFLSAVASNALEVVSHFLVNLFNVGLNFNTWFDGCPLTVAASKCSVEMVRLLLEAFDLFQSHTIYTATKNIRDPVVFDLNNALIETIRKKSNGDGSEDNDLFDIITLLVDNGANPHVSVPSRNHITEKDLTLFDNTPLCTAVTFGDLAVVEYVIDGYSSWLKTRQANRRSDPMLRSQPESFFKLVDQNEWDQVHSSLQIATAKSLFLHWRDQSTISYGLCSLYLYKRVEFLSQSCLQWLMQSIKKGILTGTLNFSGTDSVASYHFEASFVQYGLTENTSRSSKRTSYRGDRTDFKQFSEVMLKLNWFSSRRLQCKWLLNFATNHNNNYCDAILQSDEFYVVAEGKKLLAHKSICSAKSFKLAGAIRFYEANEQAAEFCDGRLLIRIELPLLKCKMLLSHIYHGSIAFGLLGSPMKQCDQILEMALIAEEYLCPTLMLECEMRLLIGSASSAPTASFNESSPCCICAHCSESYLFSKDLRPCPIRRACLEDAKHKCIENNIDCSVCSPVEVYSVTASNVMSYQTKLITSESAMNVLAVADQLSQSSSCQVGYYVIKYCRFGCTELKSAMAKPTFGCCDVDLDNDLGSGYLYKPFEAAKMTAIMVMLRDFHSVFKSESFFMQVQDDNSSSLEPSLCMASTNGREEDASLLLRTCLDEIAGCQLIRSFTEAKTVKR